MMRMYVKLIMVMVVGLLTCGSPLSAAETHLLKSKVSDIEGRPMVGAKLFVYDSPNVRRPADFISSMSDRVGQVQIALPPGIYWVVARFKSDGKYGPLLPGDKHSGEPVEIDMTADGANADFVVADIRELGQKKRATATDALHLKGHVVDTHGAPVAQAVVFANRSKEFSELPDFVSAWTGADGGFEIYLPPGVTYFVGASRQFPLQYQEGIVNHLVIERGKIDIAKDIKLTVE